MKKLKFYIPVLAIACAGIVFSTTSCVDDNESQSVTQLRGAKADQLKADAELKRVQAEVEKILAEAEKALKEAEAERIKAEIEYRKAETEYQKKYWAEEIKKMEKATEVAIKKAEAELEREKVALVRAQQELAEALAKAAVEDPELKAAVLAYQVAIGEVNIQMDAWSKLDIRVKKENALLAGYKAGKNEALAEDIRLQERYIDEMNGNLKNHKADLKRWEDLLATADIKYIENEIEKAKAAEKVLLFTDIPALETKRLQAKDVYDNASNAWSKFYDDAYNWRTGKVYTIAELNTIIADQKTHLATAKADKTKADTDFAAATSALVGLHTAYRDAEATNNANSDALVAARDARDAVYANPASTQAQKDAADAAVTAAQTTYDAGYVIYSDKMAKYYEGRQKVDDAQRAVENATNSINYLTEDIADLEAVKAIYKDESTPATLKAAYIKAETEYYAAVEAKGIKVSEASSLADYYVALESAVFNGTYIKDIKESQIERLEDAIAQTTLDINNATRYIDELKADNTHAIAEKENQIALLVIQRDAAKLQLDAAKKQADAAKAIIDAKIK
ncbi:MAG: hypothetical protein LBT43_14885 [Prevotella sp.]|jgi:hypothetical protein|nr:hypothetical protein [Prevotella sp.]